ncbi:MAG: AMP-binding protein [Clostridium sp.]|nr:AMP-binding protein [Clostridium sp.]MCM1546936.1 AMP-binding protein [Ruminococcus sp.]
MAEISTLKELVYRADTVFGNEPFVREYLHRKLRDKSFHDFRRDCDSFAVWIAEKFPNGVHAAVIGSTSYEYLTAWFGIQCSGNVTVPLDNANPAEKIADEVNRSDSEIIIVDKRHENEIEQFKKLCPQVKYFIHLHEKQESFLFLGDIIDEYIGKTPDGDPKESDLAAILFTSGTTGQSKGVMLSNGNLIDNTTCEPDNNFRGQKRMTVLPVHHVFCFTCDILCALWYGRILCVNDSLMHIPKNLKIFQPDETTFVPLIAASILSKMQLAAEKNPDKIAVGKETFGENFSVIYTGGAYLSPDIIDGYKEFGIAIAQGYGMTECSPRICTGVKGCPKPKSVGRRVPGCEIRIEDGEICVKSKSVMQGYYKNPEETAKTLTEDGWLKTGDLGYVDDDGYVYITGRKKNLIILSNGENVSPEEIENQFACCKPIKEIVVYAKNDLLTAEVYPDPDYVSENIEADIQQKIDEVNAEFPPAKRITKLIIRDTEFPKTASKKIIRASI